MSPALSRRGQEHESSINAMILLAAVIVIAIVLLIKLSGVWRSNAVTYDCSAEIRAHAATLRVTKELANPASIRCPTNVIRVDGEEAARAAIAGEMLRCWDQWGRGELALFGDTKGTYCHVCGMVYVDGAPQVTGLFAYLDTTAVPGGEQTYLENLTAVERGDLFDRGEAFKSAEDVSLSTSVPIGVIYRYTKDAQTAQTVRTWLSDPLVAAPAGAVAGGGVVYGINAGLSVIGLGVSAVSGGTIVIAGGIIGAWVGFSSIEPLDTIASVHVRELSPGDLASLGCDYAPVES